MKVLVTGATGTVGSAVVERLVRAPGFEVHAVVRRDAELPSDVIQRIGDLADPTLYTGLADTAYGAIVHCAQTRDWNLPGADEFDLNVVCALERLASKDTLYLYSGGVWVYGHQAYGQRITSRSSYRPIAAAQGRMRTLDYLHRGSRVMWTHVALPSPVYGTVGPLTGIVDGLRKGDAAVVDDPSLLWSTVERTDVAEAYLRIIELGFRGRNFVLAESEPVPILTLHQMVADRLNVPLIRLSRDEAAARFGPETLEIMTMSQPVDSTDFGTVSGWQPRHKFCSRVQELLA